MAKTSKEYFRFQKVEEYFHTADAWDTVQKADGCEWDQEKRTLILHLKTSASEHQDCDLLIQIVTEVPSVYVFIRKKSRRLY